MKKVISFCVWGKNPDYLIGAEKNALLAPSIYPGWETWFYVEEGTDVSLEDKATKVIYYKPESGSDGMFQRFRPMLDDSVDVFISRDTDSRLSDREYQAVTTWLESDKQFHAMRDHPAHAVPVLGGMWGAKRYGLANLSFLYDTLSTHKNTNYFDDQRGLASMYAVLNTLFLEHDDAGRYKGSPFPQHKPVIFGSFVGQRITWDDKEGAI